MIQLSRRRLLTKAACAAALGAIPDISAAEVYPSRPIRLVIPYIAGGSSDQIGRPWADKMAALLGPVYIENIGGGGGEVGSSIVAKSEPNGYSILLGNGSTQVMIPAASAYPAYDTVRDFQAIYRLISSTLVFLVSPSLPIYDLQELVVFAKSNPGKLSYGTPGVGTGNHLIGEMFKHQAGAPDVVHVPYRGIGQATNDLIGGQISLLIAVVSGHLLQLSETGKVRMLAVTSERRLANASHIPTVIECGMPDLKYSGWFGLFARKATPDTIVNRLSEATRLAMIDPTLQATYRAQGMEPDTESSPNKFQRLVEDEMARLTPVIKSFGLKRS